jgi:hypothetical protein
MSCESESIQQILWSSFDIVFIMFLLLCCFRADCLSGGSRTLHWSQPLFICSMKQIVHSHHNGNFNILRLRGAGHSIPDEVINLPPWRMGANVSATGGQLWPEKGNLKQRSAGENLNLTPPPWRRVPQSEKRQKSGPAPQQKQTRHNWTSPLDAAVAFDALRSTASTRGEQTAATLPKSADDPVKPIIAPAVPAPENGRIMPSPPKSSQWRSGSDLREDVEASYSPPANRRARYDLRRDRPTTPGPADGNRAQNAGERPAQWRGAARRDGSSSPHRPHSPTAGSFHGLRSPPCGPAAASSPPQRDAAARYGPPPTRPNPMGWAGRDMTHLPDSDGGGGQAAPFDGGGDGGCAADRVSPTAKGLDVWDALLGPEAALAAGTEDSDETFRLFSPPAAAEHAHPPG